MIAYNDQDLLQILKEFGVKYTEHRLELLRYMSKSKLPIPASRIIDIMKKKHDMNQATVYRGLAILSKAQVLNTIEINRESYYEMNFGDSSIVIACSMCGTLDKIEKINLDDILKKAGRQSKKFSSLSQLHMRVYGLCKNCLK